MEFEEMKRSEGWGWHNAQQAMKATEKQGIATLSHEYLSELADKETFVNVYLMSGVKLQGVVTECGEDSFVLLGGGAASAGLASRQLVFKHAVATVSAASKHSRPGV